MPPNTSPSTCPSWIRYSVNMKGPHSSAPTSGGCPARSSDESSHISDSSTQDRERMKEDSTDLFNSSLEDSMRDVSQYDSPKYQQLLSRAVFDNHVLSPAVFKDHVLSPTVNGGRIISPKAQKLPAATFPGMRDSMASLDAFYEIKISGNDIKQHRMQSTQITRQKISNYDLVSNGTFDSDVQAPQHQARHKKKSGSRNRSKEISLTAKPQLGADKSPQEPLASNDSGSNMASPTTSPTKQGPPTPLQVPPKVYRTPYQDDATLASLNGTAKYVRRGSASMWDFYASESVPRLGHVQRRRQEAVEMPLGSKYNACSAYMPRGSQDQMGCQLTRSELFDSQNNLVAPGLPRSNTLPSIDELSKDLNHVQSIGGKSAWETLEQIPSPRIGLTESFSAVSTPPATPRSNLVSTIRKTLSIQRLKMSPRPQSSEQPNSLSDPFTGVINDATGFAKAIYKGEETSFTENCRSVISGCLPSFVASPPPDDHEALLEKARRAEETEQYGMEDLVRRLWAEPCILPADANKTMYGAYGVSIPEKLPEGYTMCEDLAKELIATKKLKIRLDRRAMT